MTNPYPPSYTQTTQPTNPAEQIPAPYIPGGQYAVQQGLVNPDGSAPQPGQQRQGQQGGQRQQPYNVTKHGPIRIDRNRAARPITWESFVVVGDGDDATEYKTMADADVPPSVTLQFIDMARSRGELVAVAELIDTVVQPPGLVKDLANVPGITAEEINMILTVIADKLMAAGQALTGK